MRIAVGVISSIIYSSNINDSTLSTYNAILTMLVFKRFNQFSRTFDCKLGAKEAFLEESFSVKCYIATMYKISHGIFTYDISIKYLLVCIYQLTAWHSHLIRLKTTCALYLEKYSTTYSHMHKKTKSYSFTFLNNV